jgi:hypothetical protein
MKCRHCGNIVANSDRHCVYCGKRLGLVPTWAKLLAVPVIAVVVTVSVLLARCDSGTLVTSISMSDSGYPTTAVAESQYLLSGVPPQVDGVLGAEEWGAPAFTQGVSFWRHYTRVENGVWQEVDQEFICSGELRGYFVNDSTSLYVATALTADGLEPGLLEGEGMHCDVLLSFDGDNNGVLTQGEDVRVFDWYPPGSEMGIRDCYWNGPWDYRDDNVQNECEGAAYSAGEENALSAEFRIPLSSSDPGDLAVAAGDTIGFSLSLAIDDGGVWYPSSYDGEVGWPSSYGTCNRIVLASGPG